MSQTFECTVEVTAVTERALCVVVIKEGGGQSAPIWMPKSQIAVYSEICGESLVGDSGSLEISEWIAKEKGLL